MWSHQSQQIRVRKPRAVTRRKPAAAGARLECRRLHIKPENQRALTPRHTAASWKQSQSPGGTHREAAGGAGATHKAAVPPCSPSPTSGFLVAMQVKFCLEPQFARGYKEQRPFLSPPSVILQVTLSLLTRSKYGSVNRK